MDLDRVETLCRLFAIGVRLAERMLREGKKIQRSNVEVSKEVRDILIACEIGRRLAAKRSVLVMDAEKWITVKNGSHVKIDENDGRILAGFGEENQGKTMSEVEADRKEEASSQSVSSNNILLKSEWPGILERGLNNAKQQLDKLGPRAKTSEVVKVVGSALEGISGHIETNIDGTPYLVFISKKTRSELWRNIDPVQLASRASQSGYRAPTAYQSGKFMLKVLGKLPELFTKADRVTEWKISTRHPGKEFRTVYKEVTIGGETITVYGDLSRATKKVKWQTLHNVSSSKNPAYKYREKKMQRTGFGKQLAGALAKDDNGVASVELVHLRIVWG